MPVTAPNSDTIRALVHRVLELTDIPATPALQSQAATIQYVGGPITFMDLCVDRNLPPALGVESPLPSQPWVYSDAGEPIGGLLVWLSRDGYIEALEYHWLTDDPPTVLPAPEALRLA